MESSVPDMSDPPVDMLSELTQLYAENVDLQSKLRFLDCELNTERDTLKRMLDVDPSLPISLLVSLLSIAHRKQEDNVALASSQRLHNDTLDRLDCIRDREDWLMAAASASDGPTFFGHSRKWQGLRVERAEAEAELKDRVQQVTLVRERLAKLEVLEKQAWGALIINANRPRANRSLNRDMSRKSDGASTSTSHTLPPLTISPSRAKPPVVKCDSGMTENGKSPPIDSIDLPEIPDSPAIADLSPSETQQSPLYPTVTPPSEISQSPTLPVVSDPASTSATMPRVPQSTLTPFSALIAQSRHSTTSSMLTSSYSRSSGADTTCGPFTPFTSYSDLPGTQDPNQSENSVRRTNKRDPGKNHTLPSSRSKINKRYEASHTNNAHIAVEDQASPTFEFTPFSMAPLVITPFPALNNVPFPSSSATVPSGSVRSASNLKGQSGRKAETRDNSSQATLRKLVGRGIFRGPASDATVTNRTSKRIPNAPSAYMEDRADDLARPKSRLEPLVESWVLEQLGAPPASPSAREIAAYYSDRDAIDSRKLPRPFAGRLKPSGGGWLGGRSR